MRPLPRHLKYLWQKSVPRYPLWQPGNPQLRVFLPLFWMKILKPEQPLPADNVLFECHPQMTRHDIENYLERIYSVPVLGVRVEVREGKRNTHPINKRSIAPDDDRKIAYVQLKEGHSFQYPELFADGLPSEQEIKKYKENISRVQEDRKKNWKRGESSPTWFGL